MSEATELHRRYYNELHQGDENWIAGIRGAWAEMREILGGLGHNLRDDIVRIDPDWRSPAGDSFKEVMYKLADTVRQARETANHADLALTDAHDGLVEAKRMMPDVGDRFWERGPLDPMKAPEEERRAALAILHATEKYGKTSRDIPNLGPQYAGPPTVGGRGDGLWPPDDDPSSGKDPDTQRPTIGGRVPSTPGAPQVSGGGGGVAGSFTGIGESGRTDVAGSTAPAGAGGLGGGALPGGPGGSQPGGSGAGLPGGAEAGAGSRGGVPPGGGILGGAGGARAGRGGGRLPGGGIPGAGAGGGLSGSGVPGGSTGGRGRGAGGTLSGPGAGRRGASGGSGGASTGRGGGVGRAGMMPMGAAGAGGGSDKEKQRRGWLREQEDIWGVKDLKAAPGVLGQDPTRRRKDEDDEDW